MYVFVGHLLVSFWNACYFDTIKRNTIAILCRIKWFVLRLNNAGKYCDTISKASAAFYYIKCAWKLKYFNSSELNSWTSVGFLWGKNIAYSFRFICLKDPSRSRVEAKYQPLHYRFSMWALYKLGDHVYFAHKIIFSD